MKQKLLNSIRLRIALLVALLCSLGTGSVWATVETKNETFNFTTTGCSGWTTDNAGSYCGGFGRNKSGNYYVANAAIDNFKNVDFSAVNTPSVTVYVKALTNGGTNQYTVSLIDKDGKVVGTPVVKTGGMGSGSNSASASESSVVLTPVEGTTGYRIDFLAKSAITQTKYTLTYDPAPAAPTFGISAGDFSEAFNLTLSCATDGAAIYYTTDGTDPTSSSTLYSSAIHISATTTVKAIAIKSGNSSTVASATYTYKSIANPQFDKTDGSTVLYGGTVSLSCATPGAKIYFTQGSTPTDPTDSDTEYSGPITLTASTTIKAIAINGSDESDVVSATYTVQATTPTFSVAEGTYNATQSIEITCITEGATIYYTTNGDTPTSSSTPYSNAISVSSTQTIKAIAIKDGLASSEVASATYTLKAATPTFSVAEGVFDATQSVEISCATEGVSIYYTIKTDGSTPANPTASSTAYTGAISVSSSAIIKAIAIKAGMSNSTIAMATYRIIVPATLPFNWAGGVKSELTALNSVESSGLGSDYGDTHDPYYVKLDNDDDYIQVRTDGPIGTVSVGVKMVGGNTTSKIKVQGSTNGVDFNDVEELTIKGSQNSILNLKTSNEFNSDYTWVRLLFVKGSNVGVGPITITKKSLVTIGTAGYTTYVTPDDVTMPSGVKAYIATTVNTNTIHIEEVENVPANEPIILKASAGTYYLPVITSSTDDVSANILQASTGSTTGNGSSIYALGKKNGEVGFYLVKSGVSVPTGKAYLTIGGGSSVKDFLGFSFGDETKITETSESIHNSECIMLNEAGAVFDLSGRRVNKAQKGLYIMNGKKVLVK